MCPMFWLHSSPTVVCVSDRQRHSHEHRLILSLAVLLQWFGSTNSVFWCQSSECLQRSSRSHIHAHLCTVIQYLKHVTCPHVSPLILLLSRLLAATRAFFFTVLVRCTSCQSFSLYACTLSRSWSHTRSFADFSLANPGKFSRRKGNAKMMGVNVSE